MSEIEETYNRIRTHKTIQAIVIVDSEGTIKRYHTSNGEQKDEGQPIARSIPLLAAKARSVVRDMDPTNDLVFLRIQTKFNQIMVAPDKEFTLIVIQGKSDKKDDLE